VSLRSVSSDMRLMSTSTNRLLHLLLMHLLLLLQQIPQMQNHKSLQVVRVVRLRGNDLSRGIVPQMQARSVSTAEGKLPKSQAKTTLGKRIMASRALKMEIASQKIAIPLAVLAIDRRATRHPKSSRNRRRRILIRSLKRS